jgi:hypothetical protein
VSIADVVLALIAGVGLIVAIVSPIWIGGKKADADKVEKNGERLNDMEKNMEGLRAYLGLPPWDKKRGE